MILNYEHIYIYTCIIFVYILYNVTCFFAKDPLEYVHCFSLLIWMFPEIGVLQDHGFQHEHV